MQNKFAGRCKCGSQVEAGAGTIAKVRGKWSIRCAPCGGEKAAPVVERDMVGAIYWPNGLGYTECSEAFEAAHSAALDARQVYEASPDDPGLYETMCAAEHARDQLQGAGGHLGARIAYDKPDALSALLGGGAITVAPGGETRIAR